MLLIYLFNKLDYAYTEVNFHQNFCSDIKLKVVISFLQLPYSLESILFCQGYLIIWQHFILSAGWYLLPWKHASCPKEIVVNNPKLNARWLFYHIMKPSTDMKMKVIKFTPFFDSVSPQLWISTTSTVLWDTITYHQLHLIISHYSGMHFFVSYMQLCQQFTDP